MGAFARQLGRTGLRVSRLGLGLAAVGRPAYITLVRATDLGADRSVEAMRARSQALLDAAYAAGVRYVDAARSYGRAEEFLAEWLSARGLVPGAVTIGSKWGYRYTGGWRLDVKVQEVKDLSVGTLRRQLAESRALLGDYLCLYQVHSATLESGVLADDAVLAELRRIKQTGLAIGLTVTGPRQAETIERALASYASAARAVAKARRRPEHSRQRSTGHTVGVPHERHSGSSRRRRDARQRAQSTGAEAEQETHRGGRRRSTSHPTDGTRKPWKVRHGFVPDV
jgi:aryl-alcohol dehydrogenase-like predicted oxidoreductase